VKQPIAFNFEGSAGGVEPYLAVIVCLDPSAAPQAPATIVLINNGLSADTTVAVLSVAILHTVQLVL